MISNNWIIGGILLLVLGLGIIAMANAPDPLENEKRRGTKCDTTSVEMQAFDGRRVCIRGYYLDEIG